MINRAVRWAPMLMLALVVGCGGGSGGSSDTETVSGGGGTPAPPSSGSALPEPFDVGVSYTRELFVSTTGSDASVDGSAGSPLASISEALSRATPGTLIRVAAGTYGPLGSFSRLQGSATAPIAVVADGLVIIDGGGTSQG
ncbi:MAG: DUF1565 domain-containing protein, partial [Chromatiales bacterium]